MAASVELGDLVTVTNIPLLEVGQEYPASTGPFTFTAEMLDEVVLSQDDPHVPSPRQKLGHNPNAIDEDLQALWEQAMEDKPDNDSTPAIGTIQNMKASDDGQTLIGDLVGVPEWFATIMTTAYPARSIEGGSWKNDANNKKYAFCIQAVAWLGVAWPGCTSLADLQVLFSKEGPEVQVIEMSSKKPIGGRNMTVVAQVGVEEIRRAFYEQVAIDDQYWWWDRQTLIEPNEMIASDPDTGQLYRIPFAVSGDEVTFSDPVPVKIVYEDQPAKADGTKASAVGIAVLPNAGKVVASNKTRAEAIDGFRPETTNEEDTMDPKQIRERLGLPEDATDEQVFAELDKLKGEDPAPEPTPEGDPVPEPVAEGDPVVPEPEPAPVQAGIRTLDEGTYQRLIKGAETVEKLTATNRTNERDAEIKAATDDGRIPPARKEHWEAQFKADYDGAMAMLKSLSPGTIPVSERGSSASGEAVDASAAYDQSWLSPQERARVEAAAKGEDFRAPRITVEA